MSREEPTPTEAAFAQERLTPETGPQIFADNEGRRLRVYDPIEETVFTLLPGAPVALREASTDAFYFPVTTAAAFHAFRVETTKLVQVFVRDASGDVVRKVAAGESAGLPAPDDEYSLEVPSVGCKVYLRTDAPVRVLSDDRATVVQFDPAATDETDTAADPPLVRLGVRSFHERPAGTFAIDQTAESVLQGISRFGQALKTRSPERTFPTLRGMPALLTFTDPDDGGTIDGHDPVEPVTRLADVLAEREQGRTTGSASVRPERRPSVDGRTQARSSDRRARLRVPPEPTWVYPVTSLAYYLDAEVVPERTGDDPSLTLCPPPEQDPTSGVLLDRIRAVGDEPPVSVRLGGQDDPVDFQHRVHDLLRHLFTLDCLVRTGSAGFYPDQLAEYERIESALPDWFDRNLLYGASFTARTRAYLTIPPAVTEPAWPRWRLTVDVPPSFEYAPLLPFLANELAQIRVFDPETQSPGEFDVADWEGEDEGWGRRWVRRSVPAGDSTQRDAIEDFLRADASVRDGVRGGVRGGDTDTAAPDRIRLPDSDSVAQAWAGEGLPENAGTVSAGSFMTYLDRSVSDRPRTRVVVVCNDDEMRAEQDVTDIYGTRDHLAFDIDIHESLEVAEMRDLLTEETDFLHYIGHVRPEGLECADGHLSPEDIATLDVGCNAFVLNACASYAPAQALVEAGALAGVGTRTEVFNTAATEIGREMARLLNGGFPFEVAVEWIEEQYPLSGQLYMTFGNGSLSLVQHGGGTPLVARVTPREDGEFDVALEGYGTRRYGLGSHTTVHLGPQDVSYLNSGDLDTFRVDEPTLDWFLNLDPMPVRETRSGTYGWSDEVSAADLRSEAEQAGDWEAE
ncbi:hypothetical protein N0B31_20125 [Salinirubellus salinus]|uniref:CHAT domain-containing protein n=1 Tax=Salinirubellus salinus TaxID=1364945 RepID=A0A9E7R439_9EURY|nr:hypothetical protein [Salinirubellus salinus]UWM54413.1 hypothetical protein N0B31_20125 [Salinirubellus salinus]